MIYWSVLKELEPKIYKLSDIKNYEKIKIVKKEKLIFDLDTKGILFQPNGCLLVHTRVQAYDKKIFYYITIDGLILKITAYYKKDRTYEGSHNQRSLETIFKYIELRIEEITIEKLILLYNNPHPFPPISVTEDASLKIVTNINDGLFLVYKKSLKKLTILEEILLGIVAEESAMIPAINMINNRARGS